MNHKTAQALHEAEEAIKSLTGWRLALFSTSIYCGASAAFAGVVLYYNHLRGVM